MTIGSAAAMRRALLAGRGRAWGPLLLAVCGLGFLGLIGACLVFARRFAGLRQRGWTVYSAATGVLFFAAFFGIAAGSNQSGPGLAVVLPAFTAAVVLGWVWVSALAAHLLAEASAPIAL